MSDTDTSCYINTPHGNTHTLSTCIAHTLFFSFPCHTANGTRRAVKGSAGKNRTAKAAQDFSWTEFAQPLTAPECGVTFADRKEKKRIPTQKNTKTHFLTRRKAVLSILNLKPSCFFFSLLFCVFFRKYETRIFAWIALKFCNLVPGYYLVLTLHF